MNDIISNLKNISEGKNTLFVENFKREVQEKISREKFKRKFQERQLERSHCSRYGSPVQHSWCLTLSG